MLYEELLTAYHTASRDFPVTTIQLTIGNNSAFLSFAGNALMQMLIPSFNNLKTSLDTQDKKPYKIYLWDTDHPPARLLQKLAQTAHTQAVSLVTKKNCFFHYNHAAGIVSYVDTEKRQAYYFALDLQRIPDYEISAPLRMILHWFCQSNNILLVHAAAVAYQGTGALMVGRGGTGKSTTAALALLHGFAFVGDDYVAVEQQNNQWLAYSIYRTCKLMPAALNNLPYLAPFILATRKTQEKQVLLLNETCGHLAKSCPIDFLILPLINHSARSSLQPLPVMELLLSFASSTMLQMPGANNEMLSALTTLCRAKPNVVFNLSQNHHEIATCLKHFLKKPTAQLESLINANI